MSALDELHVPFIAPSTIRGWTLSGALAVLFPVFIRNPIFYLQKWITLKDTEMNWDVTTHTISVCVGEASSEHGMAAVQ